MGCPLTIGARTSGRKLSENDQRVAQATTQLNSQIFSTTMDI